MNEVRRSLREDGGLSKSSEAARSSLKPFGSIFQVWRKEWKVGKGRGMGWMLSVVIMYEWSDVEAAECDKEGESREVAEVMTRSRVWPCS